MPLNLRLAQDQADAYMAFRAYEQMHAEGLVPGSFDKVKTLANVFRMTQGPGSAVLMAMDGENLAGVVSVIEDGYWYSSTDRFFQDKGLYVLPDYRKTDAIDMLMDAVANLSDDHGLTAYIDIFNIKRKRGPRSNAKWRNVGGRLCYTPQPPGG